jgi:hypothetical protein
MDLTLQAEKLVHLDSAINERLPLAVQPPANSLFNSIVAILIQDKR